MLQKKPSTCRITKYILIFNDEYAFSLSSPVILKSTIIVAFCHIGFAVYRQTVGRDETRGSELLSKTVSI